MSDREGEEARNEGEVVDLLAALEASVAAVRQERADRYEAARDE